MEAKRVFAPLGQRPEAYLTEDFLSEVGGSADCSSLAPVDRVIVWHAMALTDGGGLLEFRFYDGYLRRFDPLLPKLRVAGSTPVSRSIFP